MLKLILPLNNKHPAVELIHCEGINTHPQEEDTYTFKNNIVLKLSGVSGIMHPQEKKNP